MPSGKLLYIKHRSMDSPNIRLRRKQRCGTRLLVRACTKYMGGTPQSIRRFLTDRSGIFAAVAAIMLVPLLLAVGLAIDFMMISNTRAKLQMAADAAAVGAVSTSSPGFQAAGDVGKDGTINVAVKDALRLFEAQMKNNTKAKVTKVEADVVKSGTIITSVVKFEALVQVQFMRLAGVNEVPIAGSASAKNGTPAFGDFYLLLDNSPSMGLGATQKDIDLMVKNTRDRCAFACHETGNADNYYYLAKKLGVTMRIDVMRQAIDRMMDTAEKTRTYKNQYRMALYHFGERAEEAGLERIVKPTSNLGEIRTKAKSRIDLMRVPYQNFNNDQDTDFNTALSALEKEIGNAGTGLNKNSRQKYLFITTDGVADYYNSSSCQKKTTNGRCQEPINTKYCSALKKRGVKIAILYTTYYPLPTNNWYRTWIAPFAMEIGSGLESCASPGLYFEVSLTEGIAEAMNALFQKIISQPRLVN